MSEKKKYGPYGIRKKEGHKMVSIQLPDDLHRIVVRLQNEEQRRSIAAQIVKMLQEMVRKEGLA